MSATGKVEPPHETGTVRGAVRVRRWQDWLSLVRFSHSIFALPFALQGAWLAAGGVPPLRVLALVVACAVLARTAAMGFNRLVDRRIDAANPRTRGRELPAGKLSTSSVALLVVFSSAAFVACAFLLNPLAGKLSPAVLAVLLGYSFFKRFSSLAHLVLGVSLALAPLGAWVAVRGTVSGDVVPVLWLALAVTTWVAGFDLIYACQDAEFDRAAGLHSVPARFGVARALALSSLLHVVTVGSLAMVGLSAELSFVWWGALLLTALLLAWEHSLVSPRDLSRVDLAFFTINGWIGVGLFVGLAIDRGLFPGDALMAAAKAKEPDPPAQLRELAASLPPAPGAKLARAYLLRGDERYFREKGIELVVTAARAAGLELSRHDARDPDFSPALLQDDLSAAPMFAGARCVLVRNAAALLKKEGGTESPVARALLAYVQGKGPSGGTLVLDAEGLRADHAVAKAVVAVGGKSLSLRRLWENPPPWDPDPRKAELVQWLIAQARARKLELALHDAVYMVAATGNDLFALEAALARVAAAGGKGVRGLVEWTNGVSPFQLAEDLARGDGPRALAGCEALFRAGFQDKDGSREADPAAIQAILLGTLRNKLRQSLACARALEQGSEFAAAAEKAGFQGAPAMRAELEGRVRLRDAAGWKKLVDDLAAFERRTRTGTSIDVNDFALLALRWKRVARPAPAARGAGPAARGPRR